MKESIEVAEPQFGQNTNVQIMLIFKFVKYEICREIIQKNRQPNFNIYLLENESYGRAIHEKWLELACVNLRFAIHLISLKFI